MLLDGMEKTHRLTNSGAPSGKQAFVASLYHEQVCARADVCFCATMRAVGPRGKPVTTKLPKTLRIDIGASQDVSQVVLFSQPVIDAISSGWLELRELGAPVAPRGISVTPVPADPAGPVGPAGSSASSSKGKKIK